MNSKLLDTRQQPIFLGESLGLQRYDKLKYPKFYKLAEAQEEFFWRANEISLVKDRNDYKELSDNEKFIFDSNLRWQTCTDSMLSRSINTIMGYITNPELEACCNVWSFFESNIHSRSYSHILKNVYPDESAFWDSILTDTEIVHRAEEIKAAYDDLFVEDLNVYLTHDEKKLRSKIFNAIVATNVTESLAFYVSFACSFFFGAKGKMEGNAKIIKFIERDERLHAAVTTEILKIFKAVPEEGFQDIYDETKIVEAFKIGVENEKQWADYLFQHGDLLGLVKEQFKKFAEYKANERLKILGIEPIYDKQKFNPLGSWYDEFLGNKSVQVAPQETEITSYKIAARDTDINVEDLGEIEL
jgi:ribonucleotide reductase beta subunit family protein with ferritin-like domain